MLSLLLWIFLAGHPAHAQETVIDTFKSPVKTAEENATPEITIRKEKEQTIEEYRIRGRLYMVKVTPKHGKPYYLVDLNGEGHFIRRDEVTSIPIVPQWVLFRF
jgi:hypothetical protein